MSLYQDEYENSPFSAQSMSYLDTMYELYLEDPDVELDASIGAYFDSINQNCEGEDISHRAAIEATKRQMSHSRPVQWVSEDSRFLLLACESIVSWYENYGHYHANIGMRHYPDLHSISSVFSWDDFGLTHNDRTSLVPPGLSFSVPEGSNLEALVQSLQLVFLSSVGYEYRYIKDQRAKQWFREQICRVTDFTADEKRHFGTLLIQSEALELYLGRKYVGQKRFSLEGAESFILALDGVIATSVERGAEDIVIGMAHRGRLNTMVNTLGLPCGDIDGWFQGFKMTTESISGDVKYHLGYSSDRQFSGRDVHLTLNFNPSHLESIVPVTMGVARARQDASQNQDFQGSVLPILVHGDASFTGQGVVAESLNMSYTDAYHVGGAIHIVINNQIGFTTTPEQSRSSYYCTDFVKAIDAPVLHVNGDDPEAVYQVAVLAAKYRALFKKDIVIDLLTYRRHGHNEADEASATNPLIYNDIRERDSVAQNYLALLVDQGVYSSLDRKLLESSINEKIKAGKSLVEVSTKNSSKREISWRDHISDNWRVDLNTGIPLDTIKSLGKQLSFLPDGFVLQKQVANMLSLREKMYAGEESFNWGCAEALLFASLLNEGVSIRLVGQDTCRGTFAHRHAVLHDQETGVSFVPCKQLSQIGGASFDVYNSTLSEFAAMGFEYGYSLSSPKHLVLWEAQFGDFVNGAQVIIDQYITSAWQKWARMSGLVLLLPHGYEGQGPEHSSARIERYLQLCAQKNIQVCMPSTPVQYFHLLRRQILRKFRAPLVVMMPKSLLRNPASVSSREQFVHDDFYLLLDDSSITDVKAIKRVILCSGKVYYDLVEMMKTDHVQNVAVCRVEQLYPFPHEEVIALLQKYVAAETIVWCQEEPYNQGGWYVLKERILDCLSPRQTLVYAGRPKMASSAPGDYKQFLVQQKLLVRDALGTNGIS